MWNGDNSECEVISVVITMTVITVLLLLLLMMMEMAEMTMMVAVFYWPSTAYQAKGCSYIHMTT